MPRFTYKPLTESDPQTTKVGSFTFEAGKSVTVEDEATAAKLSKNPWFKGDKAAAERLTSGSGTSPGPSSGIDSSIMPAYPPGSGMKYAPETAMTADGVVPAADLTDAHLADNATTVEDPKEAKKAGRVPSKG